MGIRMDIAKRLAIASEVQLTAAIAEVRMRSGLLSVVEAGFPSPNLNMGFTAQTY